MAGLFRLDSVPKAPADDETQPALCDRCGGAIVQSRCMVRKSQTVLRRAWGESNLLDILDQDLQEGFSYHCLTGGDVDSMSFCKHIVRQQPLDYLLFSTWCMAIDDIAQLDAWITSGRIGRIDAYVGEIFPGSYKLQHAALQEVIHKCGGRVGVFKNHSKIYAGTGPRFAFAIESSANVNTNPRTENTTITVDRALFEFYKEFYDGIVPFNKDTPEWKPWSDGGAK